MVGKELPVVDLQRLENSRSGCVASIGESLEAFGFVAIIGHEIPDDLIAAAYETARATFALTTDEKAAYERPEGGRERGYTSFGVEHAKDSETPDLKEFWHVGAELPGNHDLRLRGEIQGNVFPDEISEFGPTFLDVFKRMEGVAIQVLGMIGEYLEESISEFQEIAREGNSVLRIINYPDLGISEVGGVRAAAHEDINLLTLLPNSTRPGLEILTREGLWLPITAPEGALICDTGDMMELLTGGQIRATTHRVVNPEGSDGGRLSMPFFLHPHPDALLKPLNRRDAEPIRAKDFFKHRLKETGVG